MGQMYNPQEIINKADAMKLQSEELSQLISQMATIVSEMSSVWQSPAQQAFTAKFGEVEPQLSSYVKSINSFADRAIAQAKSVINSEGVE